MTAIVYPSSLPGPSLSAVTPAERRLLSDVAGGPQQARGLQRDYLATQRVEWDILDATEAAEFNAWWNDTLTQGGAWFASTWPAPQGWVSIVRRFVGTPQWTHLPGGFWRVSATVKVRGRGLPPEAYPPHISIFTSTGGTLSWSVTGAESVSINMGIGSVSTVAGSVSVTAVGDYTMTATNWAGTSTATVHVSFWITAEYTPSISQSYQASGLVYLADTFGWGGGVVYFVDSSTSVRIYAVDPVSGNPILYISGTIQFLS